MCLYACHKIVCVCACVRVSSVITKEYTGPKPGGGREMGREEKEEDGEQREGRRWKDDGEDEQNRWRGEV